MKLAITGKGGSGKTTIAYELSRILSSRGLNIIAVDADPSLNLSLKFKIQEKPVMKISDIIDRAKIDNILVNMSPDVRDVIDKYSVELSGNLKILVSGGIEAVGSGCLCPENAVLRSLLRELVMKRGEAVILDMEAGFEFMGRGTLKHIDSVIVVTEPGMASLSVTNKIIKFSRDSGIANIAPVANKIRRDTKDEQLNFIENNIVGGMKVFHWIPYSDSEVKQSMGMEGTDEAFTAALEQLADKLIENFME